MNNQLTTPSVQLAVSRENLDPRVAANFKENAGAGLEHLSGGLPQLKVTEANSKNMLPTGKKAPYGQFYYQPDQEAFETVSASLLAVSRGFYTLKQDQTGKIMYDENGRPKTRFNQLLGGMIHTASGMKPFVMFAAGTRWPGLNEFCKLIRPLTKNKDFPVPMYSLKVTLSLEEKDTDNGSNHVVVYTLEKNSAGEVLTVNDPDLSDRLAMSVELVKEQFEDFITRSEVDKVTGQKLHENIYAGEESQDITPDEAAVSEMAETIIEADSSEEPSVADSVADDIPF